MTAENVDLWKEPSSKRWAWLWLAMAIGLVGGVSVAWYFWDQAQAFEAVTASAGRLTLEANRKENLKVIDRGAELEVWYRVTLNNVRENAVLPITCLWIEPGGAVYHRTKYETQPITHADWETHARCKIGRDAKAGVWRVQMRLQRRTLHELKFEVRDGKEDQP